MRTLMIYIPSYNRFEKLRAQLERVIKGVELNNITNVFIYVNDNASTDLNYLDLADIYSEYEFVSIHRNNNNIGLVGNIIKAFEINTSDYIWILSDDDEVNTDVFPRLSQEINDADTDFFYLKGNIKGDENVYDGQVISSLEDYLKYFSSLSMMGLISSNIYSRKIIKYIEYMYLYGNTMFPHVAGLLKMMHEENFRLKCLGDNVIGWTASTRDYAKTIDFAVINFLYLGEIVSKQNEKLLKSKFLKDFGLTHYIKISLYNKRFFKKANEQIGTPKFLFLLFLYYSKRIVKVIIRRK